MKQQCEPCLGAEGAKNKSTITAALFQEGRETQKLAEQFANLNFNSVSCERLEFLELRIQTTCFADEDIVRQEIKVEDAVKKRTETEEEAPALPLALRFALSTRAVS